MEKKQGPASPQSSEEPQGNAGSANTAADTREPLLGSFSRRSFLSQLGAAGIAATASPILAAAQAPTTQEPAAVTENVPGAVPITLIVNGKQYNMKLEPRVTLLDALRENLQMPGTKKGCDHGQCGACTVHVDGRRVNSCLSFAIMHQGQKITTIEGLAEGDKLHPVQQAFIDHDGYQCGYCTPGQIMSASALYNEPWAADDASVREAMSGNICRCGAYTNIVAAVQQARPAMTGKQAAAGEKTKAVSGQS